MQVNPELSVVVENGSKVDAHILSGAVIDSIGSDTAYRTIPICKKMPALGLGQDTSDADAVVCLLTDA
jgi:hypothetical protein